MKITGRARGYSRERKSKVVPIVLVAIVGIIILFSVLFITGTIRLPLAITGTSTLSLQQATLQSSNPYLDGKVWLLTFRAGSLAQNYYGSFSPSTVQGVSIGDASTTKTFSIEVEYDDQICSYPITGTTTRKPIYDVKDYTWSCVLNPSEAKAKEKSGFSWILYYGRTIFTCFAYGYDTQSPVGYLNSPDIQSTFDITVSTPSGTDTKTIDTLSGTTQGKVGDFTYAVWQGNLVSGKSCPDKDPYLPVYVNGKWRTGNTDSYNIYKTLIKTTPSGASDDIWLGNVQDSANNAKASRSFGNIFSSTSRGSAIVKVTLKDPVQFPVTTLYIKASEIGIYTPTPEVKFVSSESSCFKTGTEGYISTVLKNVGDESGTWNVYAQCTSPFRVTRNIMVSIPEGESRTVYLPLSASAIQEIKGTCTIYAESPAGTKSTKVDTCVQPHMTCTPNKKSCEISGGKEVIKQCSSNGVTSSVIETCQVNYYCEIVSGEPQCIEGTPPGECKWWDVACKIKGAIGSVGDYFKDLFSGIINFFMTLKYIAVAIGGFIAFIFSKRLLDDKSNLGSGLIIGVSISIGLAIAFLLIQFIYAPIFWGILVVLLVIQFFGLGKLIQRRR